MSFLVAYNGQFTPLRTVQEHQSSVIRHVSPINRTAENQEFRGILEDILPSIQIPLHQRKLESYHQNSQDFEREKKRDYARDIMSSPVKVLNTNTNASEAKLLLQKSSIRHLPIVSPEKIIVGMVSDREVLGGLDNKTCEDIMIKKVIVCDENASVREVAITLLRERINALPVINRKHELVGIITLSDILDYVIKSTGFLNRG